MTDKEKLLLEVISMQKVLLSSLHLKDVLESAVSQFQVVTEGSKVALFLADNERLCLKLMASRGYNDRSVELMKVIPFTAESLLKQVVQKRLPASIDNPADAPAVSRLVMLNEASGKELAVPLIASNLLLGALLFDFASRKLAIDADFLRELADIVAIVIADSILYGRSEYERQRLSTLYKTSCVLSSSVLKIREVIQITADTVLMLSNSSHCAILMFDTQKDCFNLAAVKGIAGSALKELDMSTQGTLAGRCLSSGKVECILDATQQINGVPLASSGSLFKSVLALPMVFQTEPLGVVLVLSPEPRAFQNEHIELLESFTNQVSACLHVSLTHESLALQAVLDAHTELCNRWHFEELLKREIERAHRHKRELALLLIDVDHLVNINQLLGQEKGDEAIRHIAKILRNTLRDIDITCRFGGDEFGVLLPETARQSALAVAERLRLKIKNEPVPGIGTVTVSIGVASFTIKETDASKLIKASEQARDVAKFEGRDRVREANSQPDAGHRLSWEQLAQEARLSVISERQAKDQIGSLEMSNDWSWLRGGHLIKQPKGH